MLYHPNNALIYVIDGLIEQWAIRKFFIMKSPGPKVNTPKLLTDN